MPLFLQHNEPSLCWAVWKMEQTEEELIALLPLASNYEQELQRFTAPHRRVEWLSVRVLLCQLLGQWVEVKYQASGKPYLASGSHHLSISHTKGYVAVILSPTREVGIDIEQYGQRIHRVAHKFMRADEQAGAYNGDEAWGLLLHWSAKEVMFKCMNTSEVDFREHLRIMPLASRASSVPFALSERGTLSAQEYRTEQQRHFAIDYLLHPDFVLTWQAAPLG